MDEEGIVVLEENPSEEANLLNVNNIPVESEPKREVEFRKNSWSNMERIIPIEYTSSPMAEILADSVANEVNSRLVPCILAPSPTFVVYRFPACSPRFFQFPESHSKPIETIESEYELSDK